MRLDIPFSPIVQIPNQCFKILLCARDFQHFPQTFVAPIKIGDMGAELTLRDDSGMTQFLQAVYNGFSRFASDNVAVKGHFIPKEDLNLCSSVWLMSNSFINISPKIFWGSLKNSISRKIN